MHSLTDSHFQLPCLTTWIANAITCLPWWTMVNTTVGCGYWNQP